MTKIKQVMKLQAEKGKKLPIVYKGKLFHITDKKAEEIDFTCVAYNSKMDIRKALRDKEIKESK